MKAAQPHKDVKKSATARYTKIAQRMWAHLYPSRGNCSLAGYQLCTFTLEQCGRIHIAWTQGVGRRITGFGQQQPGLTHLAHETLAYHGMQDLKSTSPSSYDKKGGKDEDDEETRLLSDCLLTFRALYRPLRDRHASHIGSGKQQRATGRPRTILSTMRPGQGPRSASRQQR